MKITLCIIVLLLLAITIFGCGNGRDISSPETAVIGHWIAEKGGAEYYFNKNTYYVVRESLSGSLEEFELEYNVLYSDAEQRLLMLGIITPEDSEYTEKGEIAVCWEIKFSEDGSYLYQGIMIKDDVSGTYEVLESTWEKWQYIDGRQQPETTEK